MINLVKTLKSLSPLTRPLCAALIAAPVIVACAHEPANANAATQDQTATAEHACTNSMGLRPGNYDYQMCVLSLQQTMAAMNESRAVQQGREACAARGMASGTPEFAKCVLSAQQASAAQ